MPVQWTPDFAVGVREIDDQHRGLFDKAHTLISTLNVSGQPDEAGRDRIDEALAALADAVVKHFAMEEKLMTRLRFREYTRHRDSHEAFIDDFARLKRDIERAPAPDSSAQIDARVLDWLVEHIYDADRALAEFLSGKIAAA